MSNDTNASLVSTRPYDDFALAMRHGNPLLAAEVARANGLGSDFISEPALRAVRKFGANGFRQAAEDIVERFGAELREHYSPVEIELAIAGKDEDAGSPADASDGNDDRPTIPEIRVHRDEPGIDDGANVDATTAVHHVLPFPNVQDEQPFSAATDTGLLKGFDEEDVEDTLVDAVSPFTAMSEIEAGASFDDPTEVMDPPSGSDMNKPV